MIRHQLLFGALLAVGLCSTSFTANAAEIRIDNQDVGTGAGLDDPTPATPIGNNPGATRGEQARIVFQFAADLWGSVLQSDVPITVSATFARLDCTASSGVLGSAGTTSIYAFNAPAPQGALDGVWYHSALADALAHEESGSASDPDIAARFNGALGSTGCLEGAQWYFGLDGTTPPGSINFLNVVLHEIAHGLGFSGFGDLTTGQVFAQRPDIYSTFVYDDTQAMRWYEMTPAQRTVSALNDGNLVFTGDEVKAEAPLALGYSTVLRISAPAAAVGDYAAYQAAFGPIGNGNNFAGNIVKAVPGEGCTAFVNAAAVAGQVALIDRGTCAFTDKVANAQNAGATAVIIANNQPGIIIPGGTPTTTITIPTISVNQADGNTLSSNLTGLTGQLAQSTARAGADAAGNVQVYAPTTLAQGSSFSHFDTRLTPNAIMEYAVSSDLQGNLDLDLTPALFSDLGWGLNRGNQYLLGCDTGVPTSMAGGVIVGANIHGMAKLLGTTAADVDAYRQAIRDYANELASDGLLTTDQATSLNACLDDANTQAQFDEWHVEPGAAIELQNRVALSGQSGAAGAALVYSIEVPQGARMLSMRSFGGSGDVSLYVKYGAAGSATDYDGKSSRRGNSESVTIRRPLPGTYYVTLIGETSFTGVTVLASAR